MNAIIPEGATHYHEADEEWEHHFIKVTNPQMDNEEVLVWCAIRPEWGHWSDLPVWDKDNKDKYISIKPTQEELEQEAAEKLCLESKAKVQKLNEGKE